MTEVHVAQVAGGPIGVWPEEIHFMLCPKNHYTRPGAEYCPECGEKIEIRVYVPREDQ